MGKKSRKKFYSVCEDYVFHLFKEKLPSQMLYHDFRHSQETADAVMDMIDYFNLEDNDAEQLIAAAWFHDTGYTETYAGHEEASTKIAQEFLREHEKPQEFVQAVTELILSTKVDREAVNLKEEILHDADYITLGKKRFFQRAELLRHEWEHFLGKTFEEVEWEEKQLEFLNNQRYMTRYGLENYSSGKAKNLLKQSKEATRIERKETKLGRGIETMYRAVYRNHINLSSIADSKANMMISVNTIIVSVIVAGIGSGFTFSGKDFIEHIRFTIPIALLMAGTTASAFFAILSAMPNVTHKKVNKKKIEQRKTSVLFFGNYVDIELEKFVLALKTLRENQDLVYDNMSVDLHHLGAVLHRKYRLLHRSYLIFLIALLVCVASFLMILIVSLIIS